jgi:hypothetical protein
MADFATDMIRGLGDGAGTWKKWESGGQAKTGSSANLGFEAKLWAAADALRNNMDAAEYKHVVLGLIFLKYISDAFEAKHAELDGQRKQGADPEDPDEYRAVNIFWVPSEARWACLKSRAPQPSIGRLVDDAMSAIERDNVSLKGTPPKRLRAETHQRTPQVGQHDFLGKDRSRYRTRGRACPRPASVTGTCRW